MAVPRFELTRVYDDGSQGEPEIVPVLRVPWDASMDRKGFLATGLTAATALLLLQGCSRRRPVAGRGEPAPPPAALPAADQSTRQASYRTFDTVTQTWRTSTLPCGSSLPPGATCTCNCVPVTAGPAGVRSTCTCIPVCTCNQVCTCVPVSQVP